MLKVTGKMKYTDAHIHLSDEEYEGLTEELVNEAKSANVVAVVSNSMDLRTSLQNLKLAEQYPRFVYAALGVHPWNTDSLTDDELQQTLELIRKQHKNRNLVGIGEIGLDHKYAAAWEKQLRVFDEMLKLAEQLDLPVIIHSRGTTAQIVEMLPSYKIRKVLLHWFSSPINALAKVSEMGYFISEGAPTVYSNGIRDIVRKVPLTNLLTETDGPVLFTKAPFNGRRTTPAFIPVIVKAIAEIKKIAAETVACQISANFENFFGLNLC